MDKEIIDKEDMYSVLMDFPNQVKKAWQLAENIKVDKDIDRIIITGMGGSALPGEILKSYLWHFKMPIEVNKNYFLPEYVNSRTLVFAISYSGNTEETIEAYRNAYRKNCKIIAITSGGKLAELAGKFKKDLVMVKSGLQP
ncbi:MAG: SIS domain-containing protein, partial [Nanoarchaeota archaeon]|nr:SIS domain-containing protein [Nanoarchaeota archaeon]